MLRRRFCQRVSVDRSEQFGRRNFTKRVFVTCVELHSSSALGPRQDFRNFFTSSVGRLRIAAKSRTDQLSGVTKHTTLC